MNEFGGTPQSAVPTGILQQPGDENFGHDEHQSSTMRNKEAELFVGDLSFFCAESDLHQMFAPFGKIVKIRIKRSGATRRTLMYGFVIMSSAEEAQRAKDALHGRRYMGRDMRLVLL
jgi:RNA recognition motif-containing protein